MQTYAVSDQHRSDFIPCLYQRNSAYMSGLFAEMVAIAERTNATKVCDGGGITGAFYRHTYLTYGMVVVVCTIEIL